MNIALFEDSGFHRLFPLTWSRAAFELRCGKDRLIDKVRAHVGPQIVRTWVRQPLRRIVGERNALAQAAGGDWCLLNGRLLVAGDVSPPPPGCAWVAPGRLLAATVDAAQASELSPELFLDDAALSDWAGRLRVVPTPAEVRMIRFPWDLILANGDELRRQLRSGGVNQGNVYPGAHLLSPERICIGAGAAIKPGAVLDAEDGPIEIERGALVQSNAVIEGPCYIGPRSIIRPNSSIRPNTSIGPVCKVGGEVEGSIIHAHSNKQHDGFLGHSYVGEWVNLGADTVTSDLKNTYGTIRVAINGMGVETGQHFIGSIIGDHAKTGIGTILPTGCVLGMAANVFTRQAVPRFVPSFAWLTDAGLTRFRTDRAIDIARTVMGRRNVELTAEECALFEAIVAEAREIEGAGWE